MSCYPTVPLSHSMYRSDCRFVVSFFHRLKATCQGRPGTSSASECTHSVEEGCCSLQRPGRRTLLLRIISPRGGIVCVEVPQDCSGSQLKSHALEQFASCSFSLPHFSSDIEQLVGKYKLIRARNRTAFQDGDTLQKLGVRNEGELFNKITGKSGSERIC